jgi:hypothetical protein
LRRNYRSWRLGSASLSKNNGPLRSVTAQTPGLGFTQAYAYDALNRVTGGDGGEWDDGERGSELGAKL